MYISKINIHSYSFIHSNICPIHFSPYHPIDKEKIDRKWPASSGRQFCVVLESLNFLELSALFIWRMPNDQIY